MRDSPFLISALVSIALAIGCAISACELARMPSENSAQPSTLQSTLALRSHSSTPRAR